MNRQGLDARIGFLLSFLMVLFLSAHLPALAAPAGNIVGRFFTGGKEVPITSANKDSALSATRKIVAKPSPGTKGPATGTKQFDPNAVLTKDEIKQYAQGYGLTDMNQFNWKLALQEGDFSYFAEQRWPAWRVIAEFAAKKMVLDAANEAKATIPTKGDWSAHAERFMDALPIEQIRKGEL